MSLFQRALKKAPPIHPVEQRLAKQWIKTRLLAIYPELRNNPNALETAYHALDLQPRAGTEPGDPHSYFDITLPE